MQSFRLQCVNRTQNDTLTKLQLIRHCEMVGIEVYELPAADNMGRNMFTFEAADDNGAFEVLKSYLIMHQRGTVEFTL